MINKYYTVSYYATFGIRLYLSNVGYHVAAGKGLIFEPEFRNAQKFLTRTEAKSVAKQAQDAQQTLMIVQKHETKDDGSTVITVV